MSKAAKANLFSQFRADILWMLEPLVSYAQGQDDTRFINGNVFVEPAAEGGAYIGAVCSHAMLVIRDDDARCSEAMTLDVPFSMFRAAAPSDSVLMYHEGEPYLVDLPEWMQPGTCYAHAAGMFIRPKMRAPMWADEHAEFQPCLEMIIASGSTHRVGFDFRATRGGPADWRKPLKAAATRADTDGVLSFSANPEILNIFDRAYKAAIDEVIQRKGVHPCMHFRLTGKDEPIIVSIEGQPDFIGCLMPMGAKSSPTTPWHFLKAPRSAADGSKTKSKGCE